MSRAVHRARRGEDGFTLLETLVAFVILAASLGVIVQSFGGASRGAALGEAHALAAQLAESRLAAIGIDSPIEPGERSGVLDNGFAWTTSVRVHRPDVGAIDLPGRLTAFEIVVSVRAAGPGGATVTLETIRLLAVPS